MDPDNLPDITPDRVEALEEAMLAQEQVDCPVTHHFGPGIYIREVAIPAGTLVIGHHHKGPCMNILLKGVLRVIGPDGEAKTLEAPFVFTTGPGRKRGYALTDCVFQNIHATEETDLERLEDELIEKSAVWTAHDAARAQLLLKGE
jgi:hypothetical protein